MKKGLIVFRHEFVNLLKNKAFIAITLAVVILVAGVLSFPRLKAAFVQEGGEPSTGQTQQEKPLDEVAVVTPADYGADAVAAALQAAMPDVKVVLSQDDTQTLRQKVDAGELKGALVMHAPLSYDYIVKTAGIYDTTQSVINEVLTTVYQSVTLANSGISAEMAQQVLSAQAQGQTVVTGKDQTQSFIYTFLLIFALYFAILMYGQMITMGVATEKSSRAMELLVTSAKPTQLIFGKVFGIGSAALLQMVAILGAVQIFYRLNQPFWGDNALIQSLFGMPVSIILYMLTFFVLGFFLYAFLYAALGSLASKMEDINTLVMPISFVFVGAFMVTMFSMNSGSIDNIAMKICSFIPFTSPMAMFTRIAMGSVAVWEIILSIAILAVSVVLIGWISAKIYRVGILLYGTPPKFKEIRKLLRNAK